MKRKFLLPLIVIAIALISFGAISASAVKSGYYTYSVSNSKATIKDCEKYVPGEIKIPSTLGGFPVTKIGASAFSGCSNIKRIIIPSSVTSIGASAFSGCSSLESITIPHNVKSIAANTFFGCSSLESINIIGSVTSIGDNSFSGCSSLESIEIPSYVTTIGNSAFEGCSSLESVTIRNRVTSIGANAFSDCNLKKVYIFDIAAWCNISFDDSTANPLYYAHNLYLNGNPVVNLIIPDEVENIGDYAFQGCNSLVSVTIPDSVTSIGDSAFEGCGSLTDVYYNGTETNWSNITIVGSNSCLTNARFHFVPSTRTTLSNNRKSFTITPINIEKGKTVILALYDGDIFVETQTATYEGETLTFTTNKAYTNAKVMVWDSITTLDPACGVEVVK